MPRWLTTPPHADSGMPSHIIGLFCLAKTSSGAAGALETLSTSPVGAACVTAMKAKMVKMPRRIVGVMMGVGVSKDGVWFGSVVGVGERGGEVEEGDGGGFYMGGRVACAQDGEDVLATRRSGRGR